MSTDVNSETEVDTKALAAEMLGLTDDEPDEDEYEEDDEDEDENQPGIHPAWQAILNSIPEELHSQVIPTLQQWDTGVSRQFQKIHDQYAPLKALEGYDPDEVREAINVYQALVNDPSSTWEAIGRVYGLSPQQVSQAASSDEDDFDLDELPPALREKLAKLDIHDQVLEAVSQDMLERQKAEQEAYEDDALDEYIEELHEEYGDFDEDYVVGLIAAGVDGEEAVGRFQEFVDTLASSIGYQQQQSAPRVMSSGGGVPSGEDVDIYNLSSQNTRNLVAEILRLSHES